MLVSTNHASSNTSQIARLVKIVGKGFFLTPIATNDISSCASSVRNILITVNVLTNIAVAKSSYHDKLHSICSVHTPNVRMNSF